MSEVATGSGNADEGVLNDGLIKRCRAEATPVPPEGVWTQLNRIRDRIDHMLAGACADPDDLASWEQTVAGWESARGAARVFRGRLDVHR